MATKLGVPTGVAAVGVTAITSVLGGRAPTASLSLLCFASAVLLTGIDCLASRTRWLDRLALVPLGKPLAIALVWSALVPISCAWVDAAPSFSVLAFCLYVFVHALISASVRDLETEHRDRQAGVETLPVLLGRTASLQLLERLELAAAAIVVMLALAGILPMFMLTLALANAAVISAYLRYLDRPAVSVAALGDRLANVTVVVWTPLTLVLAF